MLRKVKARMRPNDLKDRLRRGGWSAGAIIPVADEQLVEVMALAGFGHVMIDAEHGNMSIRETESLVRAAEAAGISSTVRVPTNQDDVILRHLDTGIQGVVIPGVMNADDARRAVQSAFYYPIGKRGLAGTRAASYGLAGSLGEYTVQANEQMLVIALIEDVEAIRHLPEILAVEGLGAISIGPADLSQSMGRPGDRNHPDVQSAIGEIIKATVAAGVPVGLNSPSGDDAAIAYEQGVRLFSASPWALLAGAARGYLEPLRRYE
jgi:4-hydroxy-2-oxoheptanedioate aldolase